MEGRFSLVIKYLSEGKTDWMEIAPVRWKICEGLADRKSGKHVGSLSLQASCEEHVTARDLRISGQQQRVLRCIYTIQPLTPTNTHSQKILVPKSP